MCIRDSPVDVLLTDLGLPDVNGAELAAKARLDRPDLLVVFATGEAVMPANAPEGAILLVKPYDETDLRTAIAKAVAGAS